MTEPAPETPDPGDAQAAAQAPTQKRLIFLRKKATAEAAPATAGSEPEAVVEMQPTADERVRPGVLRRRRRQLLGAYEQAIFDLGGLAMELHGRGLLAEDVLRRRAAEVTDLRGQIDELGGRLDEIKQARQERRQAGRGASVTCPNCGTRSRAGANFCAACGTPLQQEAAEAAATTEGDQPTQVVIEEQVTSVIIEAPDEAGHTQVIPPVEGER
jgi:hypothetical protein